VPQNHIHSKDSFQPIGLLGPYQGHGVGAA
jgi:hypothetical protein